MRKLLLSIQGGRTTQYIFEKRPSDLVPFKGNFPILQDYQRESFYDELQNHMYLEECSEWVQEAVLKADQIWAIDSNFREYLQDNNLLKEFNNMSSSDKSTILVKWMNENSLGLERLNIQ